jgi:hypothetical protein
MFINELIVMAERLESLIRRSETFGKSKGDILEEMLFMAKDLRNQADRLEAMFEKDIHDALELPIQ